MSRNKKVVKNPFSKRLPLWSRFKLDFTVVTGGDDFYCSFNGDYIVAEPDKYAVLVTGTRCNQCAFDSWCHGTNDVKWQAAVKLLPHCLPVDGQGIVFRKL